MTYAVIYLTATHIGHRLYTSRAKAMRDEHLSKSWGGRLYAIAHADGFTGSEARDIYEGGYENMAPGWGITEVTA